MADTKFPTEIPNGTIAIGDKILFSDTSDSNATKDDFIENLPISYDTQAALDLKADIGFVDTKAAEILAIVDTKVDKVTGKGLSTEDYTTIEKSKLAGIADGAEVNVNADWNATSGDAEILNKPTIPTATSDLTNDSLLTSVVAGTNVTIDNTDPRNPIINSTGTGGGAVDSVNGQTGVVVLDYTDVGAAAALGANDNYVTDAEKIVIGNTSGTNTGDNATNGQYEFLLTDILGKQIYHGIEGDVHNAFPTNTTTTTLTVSFSTVPCTYWRNGQKTVVNVDKSVTHSATAGLYWIYFDDNGTGTLLASTTFPGVDSATTSKVVIASITWNGTNYGLINYEGHLFNRNGPTHVWQHTTVGARYRSGIDFTPTGTGATSSFTSTSGEIADEDIQFTIHASSAFPTANAIRHLYQTGATAYGFDTATTTQPFKRGAGNRPGYVNASTYAWTELPSATNRYVNYFIYGTTDLHTPLYCFTETAVAGTILNGYTSTANARAIPFPNLSGYGLSAELKPLYRMVVRADGAVQALIATDDYRIVSSLPQAAGTTSTTASAVTATPNAENTGTTVQTQLDEIGSGKYELICSSQTAISSSPFTFAGTEPRNAGYLVDTTSGNITINCDADLFTTGYSASICKGSADANTVIIDAQAGNTINGSQTYTLTRQYEVITLLKDGANAWKIKSNFLPNTIISDDAYGSGWNGDLNAPSKNAIYDKIETMGGGGGGFWTAMPGTPTRASNTTFTVTGDITAYVAKGMIIKWTESSVIKCAMVSIPSTFATTDTTITIVGDTMASIDASSLKYCNESPELVKFAIAGNIGATTTGGAADGAANAYYATRPMRVLAADLQAGTAGTTNSTTIDINKGGTTMFTTKPTLATTVATSPTPFTTNSGTSLALADKVTIDIDAIQTTNAIDLYVTVYTFPSYKLNLT